MSEMYLFDGAIYDIETDSCETIPDDQSVEDDFNFSSGFYSVTNGLFFSNLKGNFIFTGY